MKPHHYIKTGLVSTLLYSVAVLGSVSIFNMAHAATVAPTAAVATQTTDAPSPTSGAFVQKNKSLKGSWQILEMNGQTIIRFEDDFKASRGPDLKVFLSPQGIDAVNGQTATDGAVLLGKLQNTRGRQDYILPADVNLSSFHSVLVHCEAFSVLWGGGAI